LNIKDTYPPALTGMRGSGYPSAYEVGHQLRDGTLWPHAPDAIDTHEDYDLVVVGAGISGLSAAYFYRQAQKEGVRILILDNHDDFGGHAKRTQFTYNGDTRISNAGTFWIEGRYQGVAKQLLTELGIDPARYQRENTHPRFYSSLGMGQGVFFDKETFGEDKLLPDPAPWTDFVALYEPTIPGDQAQRWKRFLREAPLSDKAKRDLHRLYTDNHDYFPGLTVQEKIDKLKAMSYVEFVTQVAGCDPMVVTYLQDRVAGSACRLDLYNAYRASGFRHLPGLYGMGLPRYEDNEPYAHFPDGNATIARLLVRKLIPSALPGNNLEDSILATVDYAGLDTQSSPIRLRLNSTAVHVKNVRSAHWAAEGFGDPGTDGDEVAVTYARDGKLYKVRARHCILACWNYLIRYICPDLPTEQRQALAHNVKTPNLWVNVWLRNWRAFHKAQVNYINAPNSYYTSLILQGPIDIGGYRHSQSPDDPTVLTMLRVYAHPGQPASVQHRLGRLDMYNTSFETFEREAHQQLERILGPYGFDSAHDILGLTINRWGHGYTYWDPTPNPDEVPYAVRGRQAFGRISIANTDAAGEDSSQVAMEQAYRAVHEVMLL
jgi:spermidine dehydrogenase